MFRPSRPSRRHLAVLALAVLAIAAGCSSRSSRGAGPPSTSTATARADAAITTVAPANQPMPRAFRPTSASFISPTEGWVLGTGDCEDPPCTAVLHTIDGGQHWTALAAPRVALADKATVATAPGRVSRIRFTSELDGWLWGPELYATHDGGQTWKPVSAPPIVALAANGGTTWAVAATCPKAGGCSTLELLHSSSANDLWTPTSDRFATDGTPVTLVVQDSHRWVLTSGLVRRASVGSKFDPVSAPCDTGLAPNRLVATDDEDVVVACHLPSPASTDSTPTPPAATARPIARLATSADGGDHWQPSFNAPDGQVDAIASNGLGTVIVAESGASPTLWLSKNGRTSWIGAYAQPRAEGEWTQAQFLSQTVAVATLWGRTLVVSHDAGASWQPVSFVS